MPLSSRISPHMTTWSTFDAFRGLGIELFANQLTTNSTAWPLANRGIMVPMYLDAPATVQKLFLVNGTAVSGNVDLGIYDWSYNRLCRITGGAGAAQAGVSNIQLFTPDTVLSLQPGRYRFAVSADNITSTVAATGHSIRQMRYMGMSQMASALALPATWTPVNPASQVIPLAGFTNLSTL